MSTVTKDLYEIGETPPAGHVPPKMYAMTVRRENFGEPKSAFTKEVVDTPEIGPREVLVYVMAAGINYNNVWAALGIPIDLYTPIFAVSRISGWTAHVLEQYANNRLIRPRTEYTGPPYPQTYLTIDQR